MTTYRGRRRVKPTVILSDSPSPLTFCPTVSKRRKPAWMGGGGTSPAATSLSGLLTE
jgi:hypothetical protein